MRFLTGPRQKPGRRFDPWDSSFKKSREILKSLHGFKGNKQNKISRRIRPKGGLGKPISEFFLENGTRGPVQNLGGFDLSPRSRKSDEALWLKAELCSATHQKPFFFLVLVAQLLRNQRR